MKVYQCGSAIAPVTFTWDEIQKTEGIYEVVDDLAGSLIIVVRVIDIGKAHVSVLYFGNGTLQPAGPSAWETKTFRLKNAKIYLEVK